MDRNEAIKILKKYQYDPEVQEALECLHPELKEGEDERIRREIISFIQDDIDEINLKVSGDYDDRDADDIAHQKWCEKALAWLEKQGEKQKLDGTFVNVDDVREDFVNEVYRVLDSDPNNDRANQIIDAFDSLPTLELEKQDSQNLANSAKTCKVEQKPNPYSGISFEYNGHTWGMCARDNGIEILIDGRIKGRVFADDTNAKEMFIKALERVEEQNAKGYKLTDCDKNSWWEDFKAYCGYYVQNPANSAKTCKVEQKFHIEKGQWYVCIQSFILNNNIVVVKGRTYKSRNDNAISGENNRLFIDRHDGDASEFFRPWTIQDAKDGDVLCTYECDKPKVVFILKGTPKKHYALSYHCYYNIMYPHFASDSEKGCLAPNEEDVKPATKEQRDLLFQKMKEAGYEWDAEKKELKKIEQKPAWSEEDERMLNKCIEYASNIIPVKATEESGLFVDFKRIPDEKAQDWLKSLKDRVRPQPKSDWNNNDEISFNRLMAICADEKIRISPIFSEKEIKDLMDWLESIKKRAQPQWKPSDEQMTTLDRACKELGFDESILESLYNDLKKLKE